MSFQPLKFTYTPPPTVQTPVSAQPVTSSSASVLNPLDPETIAAQSTAAALLGRVRDLKATSQYLQNAIQQVTPDTVVSLNYAGDPELAESLKRLYRSETAPSGISVSMYGQLVAAEYGVLRVDMALRDSNSTLAASPYQRADLMKVTGVVEDALVDSGMFSNQLPLLLRDLQGHDLIYDSLTSALESYPVLDGTSFGGSTAAVTPPAANYNNEGATANTFESFAALGLAVDTVHAGSIDVSQELSNLINPRLDGLESIYGEMYNTIASVTDRATVINTDLRLVSQYATQTVLKSVDTVMSLIAAYKTLKALMHKPSLKAWKGAVARMSVPLLMAEITPFLMLFDRLVQRVTQPVIGMLKEAQQGLWQISGIESNLSYMIRPDGLTGTISNRIHSKPAPKQPVTDDVQKKLAVANKGMTKMIGYVQWGLNEMRAKEQELQGAMTKAMDRLLQSSGDSIEVLQTMKELEDLSSVFEKAILQTSSSVSSASQALQAGAGIAGVKPPTMPNPVASVSSVLFSGGAKLP